MTLANSWLAEHPEYKAQHCESIERKIKSGQADSEQTIQQVSGSGVNAYVRGLRYGNYLRLSYCCTEMITFSC